MENRIIYPLLKAATCAETKHIRPASDFDAAVRWSFHLVTRLSTVTLVPRLIRLRDAPRYLGMDKNRFNREVRPHVSVIRIGAQGIAFDRIDLDAWADQQSF
jgi:hypothetical protein